LGRMRRHLTIEALNHVDPIVDTDAHNSHWQGLFDHVIIRVDAMLGAILQAHGWKSTIRPDFLRDTKISIYGR